MPYVDASTLILTLQSHSKPAWDILNTELPDLLVELWVNTDILGAHGLLCELDDLLDTLWRTLLESDVVDSLVQVDGVLSLYTREERKLRGWSVTLFPLPTWKPGLSPSKHDAHTAAQRPQ